MTEAKPVNQAIAELLGWTVKAVNRIAHSKTYLVSGEWFEYVEWQLIDPNEKQVGSLGYNSEAEARRHVPDYENDLTAVVEVLPEDYDIDFQQWQEEERIGRDVLGDEITQGRTVYFCSVAPSAFASKGSWSGKGATRQQAAAKALLAYLQWKRSQGEDR